MFSIRAASTDPDGYFHVTRLAEGEYEITASRGRSLKAILHAKAGTSDNVFILRPTTQPTTQSARP